MDRLVTVACTDGIAGQARNDESTARDDSSRHSGQLMSSLTPHVIPDLIRDPIHPSVHMKGALT